MPNNTAPFSAYHPHPDLPPARGKERCIPALAGARCIPALAGAFNSLPNEWFCGLPGEWVSQVHRTVAARQRRA